MLIPNDTLISRLEMARLAVLGGCGGIGRELVLAAIRRGLRVAVLDLTHSLERHPPPDSVHRYCGGCNRSSERCQGVWQP